ncbi:hypothetical protein SD457_12440 [Coprobacillaceae bacterium CR2/5/TPMF4]|nr:hypothetical protein SD457_12440 [Coprobacillaceae bacterium CR2/5/TPMF4]
MRNVLLKIMLVIYILISIISISDVQASGLGYIKFHVDTSQSGYSSDLRVVLYGALESGGVVNETFKISETGNEWSYFVDPGTYTVRVHDNYEYEWCYEYSEEPFVITGDESNYTYDCYIKVTRPEGWVEDEEYEEPHHYAEEKIILKTLRLKIPEKTGSGTK